MNRPCLKCGADNLAATGSPTEACPACGAIYVKVQSAASTAAADAQTRAQGLFLAYHLLGGGLAETPAQGGLQFPDQMRAELERSTLKLTPAQIALVLAHTPCRPPPSSRNDRLMVWVAFGAIMFGALWSTYAFVSRGLEAKANVRNAQHAVQSHTPQSRPLQSRTFQFEESQPSP